MHTRFVKTFWQVALIVIAVTVLNPVTAATDSPEKFQVVDGVAIYLGLMPAQIVQGHLKGRPETKMHGGVPAGRYRDHLVVALFDDATGKRIEDAQVMASVMQMSSKPEWKNLEPMHIADTLTYGNYFDMSGEGTYRIQVRVRRPGQSTAIEATFTHRHFER